MQSNFKASKLRKESLPAMHASQSASRPQQFGNSIALTTFLLSLKSSNIAKNSKKKEQLNRRFALKTFQVKKKLGQDNWNYRSRIFFAPEFALRDKRYLLCILSSKFSLHISTRPARLNITLFKNKKDSQSTFLDPTKSADG